MKRVFRQETIFVFCVSLGLAIGLIAVTWDINFWPTDAEVFYMDAAKRLPGLQYISQMHKSVDEERIKVLHGKEIFIILSFIFQKLMGDAETLRPLILVCILAVSFSSVLIFLITRKYWGSKVAFVCYFLFLTSCWPYVYVLFVKHQPLGLCFFLLGLWCLDYGRSSRLDKLCYLGSGFFLCLSLYASTVSSLYLVYYLSGLIYGVRLVRSQRRKSTGWKRDLGMAMVVIVVGFTIPFLYINYPDFVYNLKSYFDHVEISRSFSHFFYNQPVLVQWIPNPGENVRGGWGWVFKYFFLIMPVLFPLFLATGVGLLSAHFLTKQKDHRSFITTIAMIAVSLSSPLLAELKGVAQYGANYFSSLMGILMLVGYGLSVLFNSSRYRMLAIPRKRFLYLAIVGLMTIHVAVNMSIFWTDIYPARMATTFLSKTIEHLGVTKIYTYKNHPSKRNFVDCLSPNLLSKLTLVSIDNINQPQEGYILVPPATGHSIYLDITRTTYNDFDEDIFLDELFRRKIIARYAVASFKTLASSHIWPHEEEVLSYKYLMLGHYKEVDPQKTRVWLLDTQKIQQDVIKNLPSPVYVEMVQNNIRNIGTQEALYRYEGYQLNIKKPTVFTAIPARVYKVGEPTDGLRGFIYQVAKEQPMWIPLREEYISQIISASGITRNPQGEIIEFQYSKPLLLVPGMYKIVVYRTGKYDDKNFYRIYQNLVQP